MMQWVENGTTPEHLIATKWNNDTLEDGLIMQRPVCPYPQKAVYNGLDSGDWHVASSWSCQEGNLLPFPVQNGSMGTVKTVCVDNCTSPGSSNKGNGSSSKTGSKSGAKAVKMMGRDAVGWGLLALLGVGYMLS